MNVAILGTWHVHTREYTEAIKNNVNANLVAIWDKDENAKAFADEFGVSFYQNLDDVLNNADIDSVVVCTATYEHYDVITKAANAKKHIFTEKVLAFTTKEAREMIDVINKAQIKFTISYPHLTNPNILAAKEILDSGKLGKITYARVRNVHNGASAGWLPPHFYDKEQCGGGSMMDLGAHPMYTLYWLLGEPKSIVSTFTSVTGKAVEDNAVSVIKFDGGAIGVSETGFVSQNNPYTLEIGGTSGSLMIHGDSIRCGIDGDWKDVENLPERPKLPIHQWVDSVNNNTETPYNTEFAYALTKLMEGAYISFETGTKYNF